MTVKKNSRLVKMWPETKDIIEQLKKYEETTLKQSSSLPKVVHTVFSSPKVIIAFKNTIDKRRSLI
jgi:hypothetical protein